MEIMNRKARFEYFIEEEYEAGIELAGTEIKSIRLGKCNIQDGYIIIRNQEAFLLNASIAPYKEGNIFNHQERRTRKLLLHKHEINKLNQKVQLKGYTLIPLKMYLKKNKVKVLVGVCRGKHDYDKRESIKEKDLMREEKKSLKYRYQ